MDVRSFFDLTAITDSGDANFLRILQENHLVRSTLRCRRRSCRRFCKIRSKTKANVPFMKLFVCYKCQKEYSILEGSFFASLQRISVALVLQILWCWSCEMRTGVAAKFLNVPRKRIVQIYRYFRDIVSWKLLQEDDLFILGKYVNKMKLIEVRPFVKYKF